MNFFIHQISVRLLDHDFKKLQQICARRKRKRADVVRDIIRREIELESRKRRRTK